MPGGDPVQSRLHGEDLEPLFGPHINVYFVLKVETLRVTAGERFQQC